MFIRKGLVFCSKFLCIFNSETIATKATIVKDIGLTDTNTTGVFADFRRLSPFTFLEFLLKTPG